ncbi:PREDICTED: glutamate--cysteine ligase catalytic subunit [Dinoponera quadriceps]|uniref:Glutamate--cysteine ligase n=1 Tax=Dinoponera quadriceps TaxID=609295 RepID=A0A6P3YFR0_DINQU|nr:PREDICTED: glutamate--cysteine ligase catalytic subunit [Dinoponera quadriceps]XP_014489282.1 PREDICTED: glutamate--cysteine ligase catalytic subunit [Dinoponera quadriceps]XP_014489283.1 PREDICTED: glutamate--cysteine ligase catalytic subunit [Dinoponera quadriceps]XP_014489284.1 PREDICTED: glutamate--cysteine ligase catalytic subunit [Dinoponera quadriceps]
MGLLSEGSPLSWEETKKLSDHVRKHGVIQFINLYKRLRDRQGDVLKWGDEVEYMLIKFDDETKTAKLSLRGAEILKILNEKENEDPDNVKSLWRPEYGAYMLEGTPGKPYGGLLAHFNVVEANMRYRRREATKLLQPNEVLMSLTVFPRIGAPDFTDPPSYPTPSVGASRSLFFPDEVIFPGHPRFKTLTRNIRERRGEKVAINIPIYRDENVPLLFKEDLISKGDDGSSSKAAEDDHIYMDAMGFGMGCCCLQLTFQACNIQEARTLYDQLTPLCPIMLALTAASPLYRGYISDVDCRWNVISSSVDCRTREERGLIPLKENKFRISKSRYDSIDSYLSEQGEKYNDVPLTYDNEIYKQLLDNGIDKLLAQHIAHLFIRDSVSLFSEKVHQNDLEDTDHFENIQSTNWQTMRFKPPPPNSSIGWRVEFRPCEVQITDFENAAIVCFTVLLTRVILSYKLNLLIPISKVDQNMARAQKRDAVKAEKFWFRRDITSDAKIPDDAQTEYTEFTINEIINGKDGGFPGLVPLVNSYLANMDVDADTHCTIQRYIKLIQKRASGEVLTTAAWLRKEVISHPEYKHDAVITQRINYDLLKKIQDIVSNEVECPELLGHCVSSKTTETIPAAVAKAENCPTANF